MSFNTQEPSEGECCLQAALYHQSRCGLATRSALVIVRGMWSEPYSQRPLPVMVPGSFSVFLINLSLLLYFPPSLHPSRPPCHLSLREEKGAR